MSIQFIKQQSDVLSKQDLSMLDSQVSYTNSALVTNLTHDNSQELDDDQNLGLDILFENPLEAHLATNCAQLLDQTNDLTDDLDDYLTDNCDSIVCTNINVHSTCQVQLDILTERLNQQKLYIDVVNSYQAMNLMHLQNFGYVCRNLDMAQCTLSNTSIFTMLQAVVDRFVISLVRNDENIFIRSFAQLFRFGCVASLTYATLKVGYHVTKFVPFLLDPIFDCTIYFGLGSAVVFLFTKTWDFITNYGYMRYHCLCGRSKYRDQLYTMFKILDEDERRLDEDLLYLSLHGDKLE